MGWTRSFFWLFQLLVEKCVVKNKVAMMLSVRFKSVFTVSPTSHLFSDNDTADLLWNVDYVFTFHQLGRTCTRWARWSSRACNTRWTWRTCRAQWTSRTRTLANHTIAAKWITTLREYRLWVKKVTSVSLLNVTYRYPHKIWRQECLEVAWLPRNFPHSKVCHCEVNCKIKINGLTDIT